MGAEVGLSAERPYPGLRPFGHEDHEYFFGRTVHVANLYNLLELSQFVAVVGSSGSGKSSLVRAGLIPLLESEGRDDPAEAWHLLEMRPGAAPIAALADALARLSDVDADGPMERAARRERIGYMLRRSSLGLVNIAVETPEFAQRPMLLLVDQFEELFRYGTSSTGLSRDEAAQFVQLLLRTSTSSKASNLHVVTTVRSDYIGDCARFAGLPEAVSACQFLVPSLTRDQLEQVIHGPAEKAGATITSELVEQLLNDVHNDPDALPVLQHCLLRLWEVAAKSDQRGRHLTLDQYRTVGRAEGALSQHADEILSRLDGQDLVNAAEQIFRALSEVDREGRATRRALPRSRIVAETGLDEEQCRQVIDCFRSDDCSFLVPSPSHRPKLEADTVIDVGHEALLRRWQRISGIGDATISQTGEQRGWLWSEQEDGRLYAGLVAFVEGSGGRAILPGDQALPRWAWWTSRRRTAAWAERYGGHYDDVSSLLRRSLDKRRLNRFLMWVGAVGAACFLVGVVVVLCVLMQRAERALEEAHVNQARFLTNLADSKLVDGDWEEAELTALSALAVEGTEGDSSIEPAAISAYVQARANDAEAARLRGYLGDPHTAVFSSDGARIVTASDDRTAMVWDARSGLELFDLLHPDRVWNATFNPSGTLIATAALDGIARIWDANDGKLLKTLSPPDGARGKSDAIVSVAFSGDGQTLLAASVDGMAWVWSTATGKLIATIRGPGGAVQSARFSPGDDRILTTALYTNDALLSDARTGTPIAVLSGHTDWVDDATFSADGTRIVTASLDRTARIWDARTGRQLQVLTGHDGTIRSAEFSPSGQFIVTASDDGTARAWSESTGEVLFLLNGHASNSNRIAIRQASFSPDGTCIVTASADGTVRLWNARIGTLLATFLTHDSANQANFSSDGTRVVTASGAASGSKGALVQVWDAMRSDHIATLSGHEGGVESAGFSANGQLVLTAGKDAAPKLWRAADGILVSTLQGAGSLVNAAAFSPDGKWVVTGSVEMNVWIFDAGGSGRWKLGSHDDAVTSVQFNAQGNLVVTASRDRTARVWDVRAAMTNQDGDTRALKATLSGHTKPVLHAIFSHYGKLIATSSVDGTARLWDPVTGAPLGNPLDLHAPVLSIAFSPKDDLLLATCEHHTAVLWQVANRSVRPLVGAPHTDSVLAGAFSPDGTLVATASADHTVRVWEVGTGRLLTVLSGHRGAVRDVTFDRTGNQILTASDDRTARLWDARPKSPTFGAMLAVYGGHGDSVVQAAFSPSGDELVTASEDGTAQLWRAWPLLGDETAIWANICALSPVIKASGTQELPSGNTADADPTAEEQLAVRYERGVGVKQNSIQALLHFAIATRLFEMQDRMVDAQRVRDHRGALARALDPKQCVAIAQEAAAILDGRDNAPTRSAPP
jgi:WD40 repeat protein